MNKPENTMNNPEKTNFNVPAKSEAEYLVEAASVDAGFDKLLKFKKGDYFLDGELLDTTGVTYTCHAVGWTKTWVKFKDGKVAERKVYRVNIGQRVPEREELDEQNEKDWPLGLDNRPSDPWVFQYLLPMETEGGDIYIFVTSSFGGKRAVADVCAAYGRKAARGPTGQPVVRLRKIMMPTRRFGDVPRPLFEIIGWNEGKEGIRDFSPETLKQEMNDDIPF